MLLSVWFFWDHGVVFSTLSQLFCLDRVCTDYSNGAYQKVVVEKCTIV